MRLIQFREPGPPHVLQCLDVPIPEPKPDEVLIRAHAIGVGIPDLLIRAGTYSWMPPLPATPGTELSGTITKVGRDVRSRKPGQRVYTSARERPHRGGHYAEYVATPAEATFVLPDSVDLDAAAALPGRLSHLQRCRSAATGPKRAHLCSRRRNGECAHRPGEGGRPHRDRRGQQR